MSSNDPEVIDGGDWPSGIGDSPVEGKARPIDNTQATLAFCLVGILAGTILLLLVLLWFGELDGDTFPEVAGLLISPLVGLVGAVTGYYYGKADR